MITHLELPFSVLLAPGARPSSEAFDCRWQLTQRAAGRLDRAGIYRTVALFEKVGVVRRINIGWKYKLELSDMFSAHHHHLTCLGCQTVIKITGDDLETFITSHQFQTISHQVEIQGYCQACSARSR